MHIEIGVEKAETSVNILSPTDSATRTVATHSFPLLLACLRGMWGSKHSRLKPYRHGVHALRLQLNVWSAWDNTPVPDSPKQLALSLSLFPFARAMASFSLSTSLSFYLLINGLGTGLTLSQLGHARRGSWFAATTTMGSFRSALKKAANRR